MDDLHDLNEFQLDRRHSACVGRLLRLMGEGASERQLEEVRREMQHISAERANRMKPKPSTVQRLRARLRRQRLLLLTRKPA